MNVYIGYMNLLNANAFAVGKQSSLNSSKNIVSLCGN